VRYLGTKQDLAQAPNDSIKLKLGKRGSSDRTSSGIPGPASRRYGDGDALRESRIEQLTWDSGALKVRAEAAKAMSYHGSNRSRIPPKAGLDDGASALAVATLSGENRRRRARTCNDKN
jgi:hypothetical protein